VKGHIWSGLSRVNAFFEKSFSWMFFPAEAPSRPLSSPIRDIRLRIRRRTVIWFGHDGLQAPCFKFSAVGAALPLLPWV
jgi:hypothetical protein